MVREACRGHRNGGSPGGFHETAEEFLMTKRSKFFKPLLVYSYSHENKEMRAKMAKALEPLAKEIDSIYDGDFTPGLPVDKEMQQVIDRASIVVFLLSKNFIASQPCQDEWRYASKNYSSGKLSFLVPIILADCDWKEFTKGKHLALPNNGKAIDTFSDENKAWEQIREGIEKIVKKLRATFSIRQEFVEKMERTEFVADTADEYINLRDVFIFPKLLGDIRLGNNDENEAEIREEQSIEDIQSLLDKGNMIIHGDDASGKTALGNHIYMHLVEQKMAVLHIDMNEISGMPNKETFARQYYQQFHGDYQLWEAQEAKTIILDNFSNEGHHVHFIPFVTRNYSRVIIISQSDIFRSYFADEKRLAHFHHAEITPLTHVTQGDLIQKRLKLSGKKGAFADGYVNQIEKKVNAVILSQKVLPRYPFHVLTIMQTFEGFMRPVDIQVTSYGHCYMMLIFGKLIKSGISKEDNAINVCLNFCEKLAIRRHDEKKGLNEDLDLETFFNEHCNEFVMDRSIFHRLKASENNHHGIITNGGCFKKPYMYYFFLGKALSSNSDKNKKILDKMCERSYAQDSYMTLMFTILHSNNHDIIDNIATRTRHLMSEVSPAQLHKKETKLFESVLGPMPKNIMFERNVDEERKRERKLRDNREDQEHADEENMNEHANDVYRILRNSNIIGQILRNRYGYLRKPEISDLIKTVADAELRIIKSFLVNEKILSDWSRYLREKHPEADGDDIDAFLKKMAFGATINFVKHVVSAINFSEIREIVEKVVEQKSTPAYDLIGYFYELDCTEALSQRTKMKLKKLLKRHGYLFMKSVLSFSTQIYMMTHRSREPLEQEIFSLLGIRYISRHRSMKLQHRAEGRDSKK